ncbi:LysM peptidoglycan-binding domain-containing protein [Flavobacterium sp. ZT3R18]|uniref:C40 family peptidase n=1 Tax=Flavobacterium sp. ZT3R18 TaxID=2594429 RepID=UPI00117A707C|nr:peptidoglycan endopeptidase [Flavobacterium sp. ZT3R18]TRX33747.1 LysM peptidoglycan-binding domain-containing protein [Flavobacterium sp. ZT3R18]
MKYFRVIVFVLTLCSVSVFSQDKNIKHSIAKGETISSIAEKYNVSAASIYKLNPKAKKTLQLNQVLLIPNSDAKKTNKVVAIPEKTIEINHEVLSKETLYGIVKQYKTTTELLYKANPKLETEGLKVGQTITIPTVGLTKKEVASLSNKNTFEIVATEPMTHQVKPKESLYSIAKQYSVTIKELNEANPKIGKKGLSVGQMIAIPSNGKSSAEAVVAEEKAIQETSNVAVIPKNKEIAQKESVVTKETEAGTPNEITPLIHKVKSGESLYVIAKEYAITLKQLKQANPKAGRRGLSVGQMIVIPSNGKLEGESVVSDNKESVPVVVESTKEDKGIETDTQNAGTDLVHEVLPKETKYGIAKKYGITVGVLEKQNPAIQQKLLVGSKLTIRVPNSTIGTATNEEVIETKETESNSTITISNENLIDQLIASASDNIGTRYRSGGTTTAGFDCSGFMCSTFGGFDIKLPRSSIEQSSFGERIETENVQKGDLIFFKTNGRSRINHVGMVVEVVDGEIKFIHSSTHAGVIVSSTKEPYYQRNFAQVNRVVK